MTTNLPEEKAARRSTWMGSHPIFALCLFTATLIATALNINYLLGIGLIFIVGIGDGYPGAGMKTVGALVLLMVASVVLLVLGFFLVSVFRLVPSRMTTRRRKIIALAGVLICFSLSAGGKWLSTRNDAALDAIIASDLERYKSAVRFRLNGDIDEDLWLAARWGRAEMVSYLLDAGANPNASPGSTILGAARQNLGNRPGTNAVVVKLLMDHGATNTAGRQQR